MWNRWEGILFISSSNARRQLIACRDVYLCVKRSVIQGPSFQGCCTMYFTAHLRIGPLQQMVRDSNDHVTLSTRKYVQISTSSSSTPFIKSDHIVPHYHHDQATLKRGAQENGRKGLTFGCRNLLHYSCYQSPLRLNCRMEAIIKIALARPSETNFFGKCSLIHFNSSTRIQNRKTCRVVRATQQVSSNLAVCLAQGCIDLVLQNSNALKKPSVGAWTSA